MENLSFRQLPLAVKISVAVTFGTAWMCAEGFVIEPLGLWKYMPYYKVGNFCLWDLAVSVIIVFTAWRASGGAKTRVE